MKTASIQAMRQYQSDHWAEEHGIVKYKVNGNYMIYNVSYPAIACEPRRTYQFKVDLTTVQQLKANN